MQRWGGAAVLLVAAAATSAPVRSPAPAPAAAARSGHGPAREREGDEGRERASAGAWDLAVADMNADQRLDLVVATGGPGDENGVIVVLLNPGVDAPLDSWQRVELAARGDYGRLAVGDIDGDGDNDVAALTFGTRRLRWWLLGPDLSLQAERSMVFGDASTGLSGAGSNGVGSNGVGSDGTQQPGRDAPRAVRSSESTGYCPGPQLHGAAPQTLSALAFADLDADRALELAVTSYASGDTGRAFVFTFERESGCFVLRPGFPQATRGSLRVRFFDVDDDGSLDLVASHYALTGASRGGGRALEWGSWWSGARGASRPLEARLDLHELMAATPTPELNIVDFDVLRTPRGPRFALAGSAHLCPAADCWSAGAAGLVGVVDAAGNQLYLGGSWKRHAELAPPFPEARLLPRTVSFRGPSEHPSVIAGYWWATRTKASPCNRIEPCPGPLMESELASESRARPRWAEASGAAAPSSESGEPVAIDPAAFVQAVGLLEAPGSVPERRRSCVAAEPLLPLPDAPVRAVLGVQVGTHPLPSSAWSWVPGSGSVSLAAAYVEADSSACVDYVASSRVELAIADSRTGVRIVPL